MCPCMARKRSSSCRLQHASRQPVSSLRLFAFPPLPAAAVPQAAEDVLATTGSADDGDNPQSTEDLTVFVQNLLQQMQGRFATMSDAIIGRIDEMGDRIDELENSIGELMAQAGIEDEEVDQQTDSKP